MPIEDIGLGPYNKQGKSATIQRMRRLLFFLLEYAGVNALFRLSHKNALTIVLYHGVAPREPRGIYNYRGKFILPGVFKKQLKYFKRHYTLIGLEEGVRLLRAGTLPPYALAITFDDGYRNFYAHAYPVLKDLGVPATMFLPSDFVLEKKPLWVDRLEYAVGKDAGTFDERTARDAALRETLKTLGPDERERRLQDIERRTGATFNDFEGERSVYAPLSLEDIREMQGAGIQFGAHTKTHPILSRIVVDDVLVEEIRGSREVLQREIGSISGIFAYPNGQQGDWDLRAERILVEIGCTGAVTTLEGANATGTHPFRLRRFALDATDEGWAFAAIASGVRLWLRGLIRYAH